jgi:hypothetical protein
VLFEYLDNLGDGRLLLADGDVDADDVLALLVDDGIERDGGLACLAVADDQFALSAADRRHGVDRLEAGLQRLFHGAAFHHARRAQFYVSSFFGRDGALAILRLAESVYDAAEHRLAHRHRHDVAGPPYLVALFDQRGFT